MRYIGNMNTQTHRFKCTVAALFLGVGFSLPLPVLAQDQQTPLDKLYQELLEADVDSYARIERQIVAQWEKSGSPAMDLLLRRGQDALEEGNPEVAVQHFTAVVDHSPDFSEGYFGRATSYYALGMVGPAMADIQTTLRLNPRHFEAMRGLASIMQELERVDDALELYELILSMNPQSQEANDAVDALQIELQGRAL